MADALTTSRVAFVTTAVVSTCAIIAAGLWGFAPIDPATVPPAPRVTAAPGVGTAPAVTVDAATFGNASIWRVPPKAAPTRVPPPRPPTPPRPIEKLELVAILDAAGSRRVALYDPASDALRRVRVGESFAGQVVQVIGADSVTLVVGGREYTLELETDEDEVDAPPAQPSRRPGRPAPSVPRRGGQR